MGSALGANIDVALNWTQVGDLPPLVGGRLVSVNGTLAYVGGRVGSNFSSAVYTFNTNTRDWDVLATAGVLRTQFATYVIGGRLYVAGGGTRVVDMSGGLYDRGFTSREISFSSDFSAWQNETGLPTARGYVYGAVVPTSDEVVIPGGCYDVPWSIDCIYTSDYISYFYGRYGRLVVQSGLNNLVSAPVVALGDGSVLLFGGYVQLQQSNNVFRYSQSLNVYRRAPGQTRFSVVGTSTASFTSVITAGPSRRVLFLTSGVYAFVSLDGIVINNIGSFLPVQGVYITDLAWQNDSLYARFSNGQVFAGHISCAKMTDHCCRSQFDHDYAYYGTLPSDCFADSGSTESSPGNDDSNESLQCSDWHYERTDPDGTRHYSYAPCPCP